MEPRDRAKQYQIVVSPPGVTAPPGAYSWTPGEGVHAPGTNPPADKISLSLVPAGNAIPPVGLAPPAGGGMPAAPAPGGVPPPPGAGAPPSAPAGPPSGFGPAGGGASPPPTGMMAPGMGLSPSVPGAASPMPPPGASMPPGPGAPMPQGAAPQGSEAPDQAAPDEEDPDAVMRQILGIMAGGQGQSPTGQGQDRRVGVGADSGLNELQTQTLQAAARARVGTPYVSGGNDLAKGIDCSGFVTEILRGFGMPVSGRPITTTYRDQLAAPITWDDIRPGDILLSRPNPSNVQYGEHMALYVGGGQMAESSGSTDRNGRMVGVRLRPVDGTDLQPYRMRQPVPGLQDATLLSRRAAELGVANVTPQVGSQIAASAGTPPAGGARLTALAGGGNGSGAPGRVGGAQGSGDLADVPELRAGNYALSPWYGFIKENARTPDGSGDFSNDTRFIAAVSAIQLAESRYSRTAAGDYRGGVPQSRGLYQMNGSPNGGYAQYTPEQRMDPAFSSSIMVPKYAQVYQQLVRSAPNASFADVVRAMAEQVQRPDWTDPGVGANYAQSTRDTEQGTAWQRPDVQPAINDWRQIVRQAGPEAVALSTTTQAGQQGQSLPQDVVQRLTQAAQSVAQQVAQTVSPPTVSAQDLGPTTMSAAPSPSTSTASNQFPGMTPDNTPWFARAVGAAAQPPSAGTAPVQSGYAVPPSMYNPGGAASASPPAASASAASPPTAPSGPSPSYSPPSSYAGAPVPPPSARDTYGRDIPAPRGQMTQEQAEGNLRYQAEVQRLQTQAPPGWIEALERAPDDRKWAMIDAESQRQQGRIVSQDGYSIRQVPGYPDQVLPNRDLPQPSVHALGPNEHWIRAADGQSGVIVHREPDGRSYTIPTDGAANATGDPVQGTSITPGMSPENAAQVLVAQGTLALAEKKRQDQITQFGQADGNTLAQLAQAKDLADRAFNNQSADQAAQVKLARDLNAAVSGNAALQAKTTMDTHTSPSGDALLQADRPFAMGGGMFQRQADGSYTRVGGVEPEPISPYQTGSLGIQQQGVDIQRAQLQRPNIQEGYLEQYNSDTGKWETNPLPQRPSVVGNHLIRPNPDNPLDITVENLPMGEFESGQLENQRQATQQQGEYQRGQLGIQQQEVGIKGQEVAETAKYHSEQLAQQRELEGARMAQERQKKSVVPGVRGGISVVDPFTGQTQMTQAPEPQEVRQVGGDLYIPAGNTVTVQGVNAPNQTISGGPDPYAAFRAQQSTMGGGGYGSGPLGGGSGFGGSVPGWGPAGLGMQAPQQRMMGWAPQQQGYGWAPQQQQQMPGYGWGGGYG